MAVCTMIFYTNQNSDLRSTTSLQVFQLTIFTSTMDYNKDLTDLMNLDWMNEDALWADYFQGDLTFDMLCDGFPTDVEVLNTRSSSFEGDFGPSICELTGQSTVDSLVQTRPTKLNEEAEPASEAVSQDYVLVDGASSGVQRGVTCAAVAASLRRLEALEENVRKLNATVISMQRLVGPNFRVSFRLSMTACSTLKRQRDYIQDVQLWLAEVTEVIRGRKMSTS